MVTLTPPPTSTIDRLSTKGVLAGIETTITVYGFDFGQDSVVRMNQVNLATIGIGPGELQATIPAAFINVSVTTTFGIDVAEPAGLPSNRAFLDALVRTTSDVNCDNFTNSLDALDLLRFFAGTELPADCSADANLDTVIDLADVLWIRLEIAGLIEPYYPF